MNITIFVMAATTTTTRDEASSNKPLFGFSANSLSVDLRKSPASDLIDLIQKRNKPGAISPWNKRDATAQNEKRAASSLSALITYYMLTAYSNPENDDSYRRIPHLAQLAKDCE